MTPYESFMKAFKNAVAEKGNLKSFADSCGMNYATLYRWYHEAQVPSLQAIEPLLPFLDLPPVIKRIGECASEEAVKGDNLPTIPVFFSAGAGFPVNIDIWSTEPEKFIQVLPQYYRKDAVLVEVVGDSMEPTIQNGSFVGVVPFSGRLREGGIYLVNWEPFGLVVKRVRSNKQGEIVLISDNPNYEPQPLPYEGYDNVIIGEVLWYIQKV